MITATRSQAEPARAEPVRIGPTGRPAHTLLPVQLLWIARWLRHPDGPNAGSPWRFTGEQIRFLAWWYAVAETGSWVYRRGTLRRAKGWGKDPVGAVLSVLEAVGPCRFGGWAEGGERAQDYGVDVDHTYRPGEAIAIPNPAGWVQIAAVSRDQVRTTMRLFPGLIPKATRERFAIEVHKEVVYLRGGMSVIEAITSSPKSAEGPRSTFVIRNEIQNWLANNDGHEMAEVVDGNLTKSRDGAARALSMCNAHVPGMDSVGEREWDAWQAVEQGRSRAADVLYDALEAPPDTDLADEASLRRGLVAARGDSTWLNIDRHVAEIYDPRTRPTEARRKFLNQIIAAEDSWVTPQQYDRLGRPPAEPLAPMDIITLGFDGSKTDDHSALIACRVHDGATFTLGNWDPAEHKGEAPRELIDGEVRRAFGTYDVVAFYADLEGWESYVDRWDEELGRERRRELLVKASPKHRIAWDMRARNREFTLEGAERLQDEIEEGAFRHDAHPRTRQHFHNARRRPNAWGVTFGKEHRESKRKVDAVAATALARMARRAYLALPAGSRRRQVTGRVAA